MSAAYCRIQLELNFDIQTNFNSLKQCQERDRVFIRHNGNLSEKDNQCPSMLTTYKIQKYKCDKNLPVLISTAINTYTVISQYLFTGVDKMK